MNAILKFFFYSIALVSLAWIRETPAELVTWIEWVRVVQAPNALATVLLVTASLFLLNLILTGSFGIASRFVGDKLADHVGQTQSDKQSIQN